MVSKLFQFAVILHVMERHKHFYYFMPSFEILVRVETLLLVEYVS